MSETTHDLGAKYLVDPYLNWAKAEGVPIVEGAILDLLTLETKPWARFGVNGAICHVEGRCDFLSAFLFELAPGQGCAPMRHLYEDCFYVLEGRGVGEITLSDGARHNIAWGEGCVFTIPVNANCVLRADGASRARLVSFNDLRYLMGLYRNEDFLFHNPSPVSARQRMAMQSPLCIDLAAMQGSTALQLGDSAIGADYASLAPGAVTRATRQMQGAHMLGLRGEGVTVSLVSETSDRVMTPWRRGSLIGLPGMEFHQHRGGVEANAAFLKVELGSQASPLFRSRRAAYGDTQVYASGSAVLATV
jgi:mannose-6-phosphate isomerase-like protein (cupin superfamily)